VVVKGTVDQSSPSATWPFQPLHSFWSIRQTKLFIGKIKLLLLLHDKQKRHKMTQPLKIKVFINNFAVILSHRPSKSKSVSMHIDDLWALGLENLIKNIEAGKYKKRITIWGDQPLEMLEFFKKNLKIIVAGGGLVQNPDGAILFIFRNGRWDLPKGKPEEGEDITQTAIREVEEECGISGLTILEELPLTHHIYKEPGGEYILKKCIWYHMESLNWENLTVQREEGITEAQWIKPPASKKLLKNAYPSIKVLVEYFQKNYLPPAERLS
jgi:8-oxo-dGTP pyrophosphatase MutT (NUDIX family)